MTKELYNSLTNMVLSMDDDVTKFYHNKNKAAGKRIRKQCQEIKTLVQQLRIEILNNIKLEKETKS